MEAPEMVRILGVASETPSHKTFILEKKIRAVPGQFCMLWIPGVDEKPFSFSGVKGNVKVTVKKIGGFTEELFKLRKGDLVGFRGPYGKGFAPVKGRVCLVGGGCGIAPLLPLKDYVKGDVIIAAKNKSELMFSGEFKKKGFSVHLVTDDGSAGMNGFAHEKLAELLKTEKFTMVYTCGPEIMMKKVLDLCLKKKIPCQLSLERYMKCGIGVCGSCMLSEYRVCKEGPVFTGKQLSGTEFGVKTRNACGSGKRI
ncbi:MAG: dihydroorotate dehydrogenase electron transfer subunit [Candidatus Altiarchaeota archaeon]|nr:dihydroorotate dehydrogenase electron transfer subunit [Candidatus Altiarchaeota archaeon]